MNQKQYNYYTTLWKGVWSGLQVSFGIGGAMLLVPVPEDVNAFQEGWPAFTFAVLVAGWKMIENYRKNGGYNGQPVWIWKDVGTWISKRIGLT